MYALLLAAALSLATPGRDAIAAPASPASPAIPAPAPPASVMTLPPELRQRLQDKVLSAPATQQQRLEQLLHFMLDADALAITYDEAATYSVEQTYVARRANCLSFTLLFLAMAREAGLDARPQEIEETLSWRQEQNTIYRNNHVNVGVRIKGRTLIVDSSGNNLVAGDRPVGISDQRLLAHYYNNLAMDQLALGNTAAGLHLMQMALTVDPTHAPFWSNAGVLHVHEGDLVSAERAYLRALALDPDEDGALLNMGNLARRLGDAKREAAFQSRLARVQQKDPLHHFIQAMDYEQRGDYVQAIAHYRRAIRLYNGEHRFYSALARVYLKAGNPRRAGKALVRAQALTNGATRAAYSAQLQELKRAPN